MMKFSETALKQIQTLQSCSNIGENAKSHYLNLIEQKNQLISSENFQVMHQFLQAIGNQDRFLILTLLKESDKCVCELEVALGKSQPSISRHLRILEESHLIQGWKRGKFTHYSLIKTNFDNFLKQWQIWHESATNWLGKLS